MRTWYPHTGGVGDLAALVISWITRRPQRSRPIGSILDSEQSSPIIPTIDNQDRAVRRQEEAEVLPCEVAARLRPIAGQ
jgi:hypothetical protein